MRLSFFFNSGVAGVGAAVQSVQAVAEQSLSVAMTKIQASLRVLLWDRASWRGLICTWCDLIMSAFCFQELSGQQQSASEPEFDFPQDETSYAASEFREEHTNFTADHSGTGTDAPAGTSTINGKQSMFEGYKDPSNQYSGQTRSYHQDAR